jgi:hypothetical protein
MGQGLVKSQFSPFSISRWPSPEDYGKSDSAAIISRDSVALQIEPTARCQGRKPRTLLSRSPPLVINFKQIVSTYTYK